jgi:hypothetical protein
MRKTHPIFLPLHFCAVISQNRSLQGIFKRKVYGELSPMVAEFVVEALLLKLWLIVVCCCIAETTPPYVDHVNKRFEDKNG